MVEKIIKEMMEADTRRLESFPNSMEYTLIISRRLKDLRDLGYSYKEIAELLRTAQEVA